MSHLKLLFQLFEKYRQVSGLTLKPKKCFAILVANQVTVQTVALIRCWLRQNVPSWANLQICSQAKYLGIYLGPVVGGKNWEAPMNKFIGRVEEIAQTRAPLEYACALFKSKALSVLGYVAQICKPPKALKVTELRAANKILRLATNSFTTNCVYQLDAFHGPKLERPVVFLHSCMIRAAAKTLAGFSQQHLALQEKVIDSLPLAHLLSGSAKPEGWDSEAFCSKLHYAYLGVHSSETFPNARSPICSLIRDFQLGRVKGGFQAKVSMLLKTLIPNEFPRLFRRRFETLEIDCGDSQLLVMPVRGSPLELKHLLLPLPHSTPMCLLRTWSNGWCTSNRMHEPKALPCFFGCEADDDLCHYLKCEVLWTCVYSCFKCNTSIFMQSIPGRACVHNVNMSNIARLYCAYSSYHALRKLHTDLILDAISSEDFEHVVEELLSLIILFGADTNRGVAF